MKSQQFGKKNLALIILLFASSLIVACNTGIDRNQNKSDSSSNSSSNTLDDGEPADPSYIKLNEIAYESKTPSIISILLQAKDKDNRNINSLTIENFQLSEDGYPIPAEESASFLVRREFVPLTFDTVVMLDVSSSISQDDLKNMKQAVNELVRDPSTGRTRIFHGQRVTVYSFNDNVNKIKDFSTSPSQIVKSLDTITLPNSITPTDLYGALIAGSDLWVETADIAQIHEGIVILITDGSDTAGRHTLSSTINRVDKKKVITIGVGEDVNEDVLEELGNTGFYTIENFSELSSVLATIRKKMNRYADSYYLIKHASPKRAADGKVSKSDHYFTLEIKDNDNSKSNGVIKGDFNSYKFSNVVPRAVIGGINHLEPGQSTTYLAQTYWANNSPSYSWAYSGDCSLDKVTGNTLTISATNAGNCQISVTDNANNSVLSNISVSISNN